MNPDKKIIVEQLLERINTSPYLLLVDYTGMTVPQINEIRKRLRAVGGKFHVTKNSYVKAAAAAKGLPKEMEKDLSGQTAVVFGDSDVCAAAKAVKSCNTEFQRPAIKSGTLDGAFLTAADIDGLAAVGSRENLLAKLLGVLNAPAGAIARAIAAKVEKDGGAAAPAA